jgi:hypothetical protein
MITIATNVFVDGSSLAKAGRSRSKTSGHTPEEYETSVRNTLGQIQGTKSGRALIRAMTRVAGKKCVIVPDPTSTAKDPNAWAEQERYGSSVHFTPWIFTEFLKRHRSGLNRVGFSGDEIIFHEMVHALREMSRLMLSNYLGSSYDDIEEFIAILVANIYISEKNDADPGPDEFLRADHRLGHALDDKVRERDTQSISVGSKDPSGEFLGLSIDETGPRGKVLSTGKNRDWVAKLIAQQPDFCRDLADIDCTFNPVRRLMQELKRPSAKIVSSTLTKSPAKR